MEATLSWAAQETGPVLVHSLAELDTILADIESRSSASAPTLLLLRAHGREVTVVVGGPRSFVQIAAESGLPPYLVAQGDPTAEGVVEFMLDGLHHTEVLAQHVLPAERAAEIVRHFVETGRQSPAVEWTEV